MINILAEQIKGDKLYSMRSTGAHSVFIVWHGRFCSPRLWWQVQSLLLIVKIFTNEGRKLKQNLCHVENIKLKYR